MSDGPPSFDAATLLAMVRSDDRTEIGRLYTRVFGTLEGRAVLAHLAAEAGLGTRRGSEVGAEGRAYHDGRVDVALEIFELAGLDQFEAVRMVQTENLEGHDDERSEHRPRLD